MLDPHAAKLNEGLELSSNPQVDLQREQSAIAEELILASRLAQHESLGLIYYPVHQDFADLVSSFAAARGAKVELCLRDLAGDAASASMMEPGDIAQLHSREHALSRSCDRLILLAGGADYAALQSLDVERLKAYNTAWDQALAPRTTGRIPWLLTTPPLPSDAELEGMPFSDFISCFRSACAQPWKEIHAAQEVLIEQLNQGSQLTFRANQDDPNPTFRTEVSMSIKGMTFCNSTIARNFPGSEVFSAPLRTSVNGQIFAPGRYVYEQAPMTDMLFRIKDGEIVFAEAREGNDELQRILSNGTQRAARFFGETALGTNPGIGRRMVHPLLAEKTAGTFHMAIGHCYEHTNYEGTPVTVNNGNTSDLTPVHWDITIPMYPAAGGGEVILDGDVIQRDGEFLDNRLSLLSYRKN